MREFIAIIVGLVGGFILGIVLSSIIGIFGVYVLGQPMGIKFLPFYMAILCGIVLPVIEYKRKK
ncbi:DUF5957 family protein [Sutcliffiella rhizosphaerae]|uniref:Uncharacterized protein n=1 Tax=Sutcliffiella rhizosphaerae TaxID=2880967 RepID=A0ABM8YKH5_9BACI|nr:DUF5957 family protein [Sutcliffiella rhizosphaerae]CAG9620436.1 hypothetical protein BACCIP111883_01204 [Sutcliffiella rhizosphaerae]